MAQPLPYLDYLIEDPIETVAMKALRVNVSDLVAKGARPAAALSR